MSHKRGISHPLIRQRGLCVAARTSYQFRVKDSAMDMTNGYVIATWGVTKTYAGVRAVQDLNLTVPRYPIFSFLGPNGAGKSSTGCPLTFDVH
jgi:ABC-type uncharacterized transport system ATPase subunit